MRSLTHRHQISSSSTSAPSIPADVIAEIVISYGDDAIQRFVVSVINEWCRWWRWLVEKSLSISSSSILLSSSMPTAMTDTSLSHCFCQPSELFFAEILHQLPVQFQIKRKYRKDGSAKHYQFAILWMLPCANNFSNIYNDDGWYWRCANFWSCSSLCCSHCNFFHFIMNVFFVDVAKSLSSIIYYDFWDLVDQLVIISQWHCLSVTSLY